MLYHQLTSLPHTPGRLGHVLERVLRPRSVLALTATATRATQASITSALGMAEGDVVRACPLRDNLRLQVGAAVPGGLGGLHLL